MIEKILKKLSLLFGKEYNVDKAREDMVKEFRKNPMIFNNSNYRPTSFSLKIDSFMMGLGEWRNNRRRYQSVGVYKILLSMTAYDGMYYEF